jgi:predicted RNase H-like HicB family nuclease
MKLKVIIHPAEEGGFSAEVPALPGCFSQGETIEEIRANIREAIECHLDAPAPVSLPEERGTASQILLHAPAADNRRAAPGATAKRPSAKH